MQKRAAAHVFLSQTSLRRPRRRSFSLGVEACRSFEPLPYQGQMNFTEHVVLRRRTSADEAVGASGQVEGVSAAAHEVAGSTAQLVAASRARAPPESPALARLTQASRSVAAATGALVAAVKAGSALVLEQGMFDTLCRRPLTRRPAARRSYKT